MHCDVVIIGYRLNAKEPAAKALERILGMFAEDARKLARSFPATVLAAGSQEQAERLMQQLTEAGALVELRASKPMPAPVPREAQLSAARSAAGHGRRASLPMADKHALDLASAPRPRPAHQGDAADLRARPQPGGPPPPPPEALANYQLGDFGLAPASVRPGPILVVPPPPSGRGGPPTGAARRASVASGTDLDFDLSGIPLELDQPESAVRRGGNLVEASSDMRGERFSDSPPSTERAPQVEEAAFRSIQRAPRPAEVRRSGAPRAAKRTSGGSVSTLRAWAPSTFMLATVSVLSLSAVGYALDPDDAFGALLRERAALFIAQAPTPSTSNGRDEENLHPLLRATPSAARAPLAAILRGNIPGVHDVSVAFSGAARDLHCAVVEQAEGETESRLARVRQTGREVGIPGEVSAQLKERESSLRAEAKRPDLSFVEICLSL